MSYGMGREFAYLSSHATNRYFIPNWGIHNSYSLNRFFFFFLRLQRYNFLSRNCYFYPTILGWETLVINIVFNR